MDNPLQNPLVKIALQEYAERMGEILFRYKDTYGLTIETMKPIVRKCLEQYINEAVIHCQKIERESLMVLSKKFCPEVLVELRKKKDLSQEGLARELSNIGLTRTSNTIQKWEGSKTAPDVNDLVVIAAFFGVPIQRFFK